MSLDRTISPAAIKASYDCIHSDLGDLSDLPRELATTVANVYYRFFVFSENPKSPSGQALGRAEGSSQIESYQNYMEGSATVFSSFQFTKGLIETARQTRQESSSLFQYLIVLTLDVLKYNIENADEKTPIRRAIERKFKKVDEIPDLLDVMAARGLVIYKNGQ